MHKNVSRVHFVLCMRSEKELILNPIHHIFSYFLLWVFFLFCFFQTNYETFLFLPQPKLLAVHYCDTTVDKAVPVIVSSNNISETVARSQLINSSVQCRGVQSRTVLTTTVWSKQDPGGKKGLVLAGRLAHFNKSMR